MTNLNSVDRILSSTNLKRLLQRIRDQNQLLAEVKAVLPPPLDAHCVAAAVAQGRLTVYADSPAWASRIRFLSPAITIKFNDQGVNLKEIRTKVLLPHESGGVHRTPRPARLSQENAAMLQAIAEDIADPQLSAALRRLSRLGRNGGGN